MPIVSVIVPVYKVKNYLPRCIDSILGQSFPDFELILVDDGSPDNCGKMCDEYASRDERIRVIHQKNSKVSAARNAGIEIARGDWIAFIDSDDWIHKDYLKILLSGALIDTDIVICNCLITKEDKETDKEHQDYTFKSVSLAEIYKDHYARSRAWGRIIKRKTIGKYRYITGSEPAEDSCFNELLYSKDMHYRITDAKLYYYYMRSDSAIHTQLGRGALNAIDPLLKELHSIEDKEKKSRIIQRCYKYLFSARYGERYTDDYNDVKKSCNGYFKKLSCFLPQLSKKEQLIMTAFRLSPSLYRIWRVLDDPSLLRFEKQQRIMKRSRQEGQSEH